MSRNLSLSDESDPLGFSLRCEDDSLNLIREFSQGWNDWRAGQSLDFAERYSKGEVDLIAELTAWSNYTIYHLIFFTVPNHIRNRGRIRRIGTTPQDHAFACGRKKSVSNRFKQTVEALPPDAVECNEQIVPSWIRLERAKQRHDIRREILASSAYGTLELSGIVRNGEVNEIRTRCPAQDRNSICSLIEGGTQCFQGFVGNVSEPIGESPPDLDLVRLAESVRVRLNHANIGLFFKIPLESGIECTDVLLCPAETALWAGERV